MPLDVSLDHEPDAEVLADPNLVGNSNFIRNLRRLQELRTFLIQEAVAVPQNLSFEGLNALKFQERGRSPRPEEWSLLEDRTAKLFSLLTPPLRRKFMSGSIPSWMALATVVIGVAAAVSLIGAVIGDAFGLANYKYTGIFVLLSYIVWLVCLGAIGSIAFIGMNALSVQDDITFDLTNNRLMVLRIVLGGLFALVMTLPFGVGSFVHFCSSLNISANPIQTANGGSQETYEQAGLLLMPFVLGFSTSLVIIVLNRLVGAIEAFFGGGAAASDRHTSTIGPNVLTSGPVVVETPPPGK